MNTKNKNDQHYNAEFYKGQKHISKQSAEEVIPLLIKLLNPQSVADVGCGVGTWLSVWKNNSVHNLIGIDGDYVDRSQLQINVDEFIPYDLTTSLIFDKKFDIATSFEVGEHIPTEHSDIFVKNICSLSNVIVFSAALPGQGGTNHINEQWPSYWAEIFKKYGYQPVDCLRMKIWNNDKIGYYYRQNMIVFIHQSVIEKYIHLTADSLSVEDGVLSIVHPDTLQKRMKDINWLIKSYTNAKDDVHVSFQNFKKNFIKKAKQKLNLS
ncbi:MAG: methyltransferase domain-containing protein [Chitinophagales bacterium]